MNATLCSLVNVGCVCCWFSSLLRWRTFLEFNHPTLLTNTSYNSIGNPRATGFSVRLLSATFVKQSKFILFSVFIYLSRIFHLNPSKIPRDTRSDRNPQYWHTSECKNRYLIGIHLCLKIMKIATKPFLVNILCTKSDMGLHTFQMPPNSQGIQFHKGRSSFDG